MQTIRPPMHSNHFVNDQAARAYLKFKGCPLSDLNELTIGKPVPLPKRTLHLNEVTGEWVYYPVIDVEV